MAPRERAAVLLRGGLLLLVLLLLLIQPPLPGAGAAERTHEAEIASLQASIAAQKELIRGPGNVHTDHLGNWQASAPPPPKEDEAVAAAEDAYAFAQVRRCRLGGLRGLAASQASVSQIAVRSHALARCRAPHQDALRRLPADVTLEVYDAHKAGITRAREQLRTARDAARAAGVVREKSRGATQADAVKQLARLTLQLEEQRDRGAEAEAVRHSARAAASSCARTYRTTARAHTGPLLLAVCVLASLARLAVVFSPLPCVHRAALQEAHHETADVFQDIESVEPAGGKAAEHQATVIWLHGMGEDGGDWRRQLVHTIGKGRYVTALPVRLHSRSRCAAYMLRAAAVAPECRLSLADQAFLFRSATCVCVVRGCVCGVEQGVRWLFPTAKLRRYPLYGKQPL